MVPVWGQVPGGRWRRGLPEPDPRTAILFGLLNEVGIIAQLSGRLLERHLPDGFGAPHFTVLNHLVRLGDGRTPLSIARAFQVPKTTMTHTLAGLERDGLVRFAPNPRDGRSKCVMLTQAGRAFRDAAIARLAPDMARMAEALDPDRIASVLPVLTEMRQYLDQDRDQDPDGGPAGL
jgi:DNA-binding MarR family transcriptional regulator